MDKVTKKLMNILRENDMVVLESNGSINIPGLDDVGLSNDFETDVVNIQDLKKFKEFVYNGSLNLRIATVARNLDEYVSDNAVHMINPYNNDALCTMRTKLSLNLDDSFNFGDKGCESCKYYNGKKKCLVREYETAKG